MNKQEAAREFTEKSNWFSNQKVQKHEAFLAGASWAESEWKEERDRYRAALFDALECSGQECPECISSFEEILGGGTP